MVKLFGNDPKKFLSAMFRFRALEKIVEHIPPEYKRNRDQNTDEIHEDVVAVAAFCPLTKSGKFHKQKFLAALKKLKKAPIDQLVQINQS